MIGSGLGGGQCIDPNGGGLPEFGKIDAQIKRLGRWRVNDVNASAPWSLAQKAGAIQVKFGTRRAGAEHARTCLWTTARRSKRSKRLNSDRVIQSNIIAI
jgi:hypothetical protein